MIQKQERKIDRNKTLPDITLKAVRAVKIHNLSIRQALDFIMNQVITAKRFLNMYQS